MTYPFRQLPAALRHTFCRFLILALAASGLARSSEARSSMTSRFAEAVAGPGVAQTARLIVDYFPGDGEAVIGLRARLSSQDATLVGVQSRRGRVFVTAQSFNVDYSDDGIGQRTADTLEVRLLTSATSMVFDLSLTTNVDTPPTPAHQTTVGLVAVRPLQASLATEPAHVYPGESVEFRLRAERASDEERPLELIGATWPSGLVAVGDPVVRHDAASAVEVSQSVRVRRDVVGPLSLQVSAVGAGLLASPLGTRTVEVAAVPFFFVEVSGDPVRGEIAHLRLHWHNRSDKAIPTTSLEATAAAGFAGARLASAAPTDRTAGVRLAADEEKGSVAVHVSPAGDLEPGQDLVVALDLTPLASGPFTVTGQFLPPDRRTPVILGNTVLKVIAPEATERPLAALVYTDLELARSGLEQELRGALSSLPLARGASLRLSSSRSDDGNWVVEGLLTDLLLERGVRVMADSSMADVLHYRLADARVVYSPSGSAWNLMDDSQRRDARMEVLLRLEDASGRILWAHRVASSLGEKRAPADASWLGGAKGIDQVSVTPDHRAIEFSLSGLIVGGLFFVFFAP